MNNKMSVKLSIILIYSSVLVSMSMQINGCGPSHNKPVEVITTSDMGPEDLAPPSKKDPHAVQVSEELLPWYVQFLKEADKHGIRLEYALGFLDYVILVPNGKNGKNNAGMCFYLPWSNRIEIARRYTDIEYPWLVYHEMGHCVLGFSHIEDTIMSTALPLLTPSPLLPGTEDEWEQKVEEFWNRAKERQSYRLRPMD